jgi:hydrogenase maturation factor HypF (carbamoyltransferase family)
MEDSGYILCTHCGEEYTEEELYTLDMSRTWQHDVCDNCINKYEEGKQRAIDAAISAHDDDWDDDNHERYRG